MVAAAIIGSSLASGLGGVVSGGIQGQAAGKASQEQVAAQQQAIAAEKQYFGTAQGEEQPFANFGVAAGGQLSSLLGLNGGGGAGAQATLNSLPGFQFAEQQGQQAVNNGMTARGLGLSGAQVRGSEDYASGIASQNYSNYVNELLGFTNLGANAATSIGNQATTTGGNIAGALTGIGNAQAAGTIGQANAQAGQVGSLTGALGSGVNNYAGYSLYQNMLANAQGGQYSTTPISSETTGFAPVNYDFGTYQAGAGH
jgi:hypothetical protein